MTTHRATLTGKCQITIPAAVRRRLGLKPGDVVYLAVEEGQVLLRAMPGGWTEASRGLGEAVWGGVGGADAIERERESWGS
jgi:AbrB family looped-hinge helix DNA binding protein